MAKISTNSFIGIFLCIVLAIAFFGFIFVYSASYTLISSHGMLALKHVLRMCIGMLFFFGVIMIGYKSILNISYPLYFVTLVLLVLVLVVGTERYGAQRWLFLGPLSIQPSEFAKLSILLTLAHYLGNRKRNVYQKKRFVISFLLMIVPLVLILKQPDLGTSLVFLPILFCMLYVWGARIRYFLITVGLGVCSSPVLWMMLKPYQKDRLFAFLDPNRDPLGASYTVIQSKIAIGAGGLMGKGWLHGTQNKLSFIPEHHTDFIFSVVGEEGGFIAVLVFLLLFILFFRFSFMALRKTTDTSGRLLAAGIIAMFFFHVLINVGMTIGLMPVAGVPLPFVSYGGSALITFFLAAGLIASIYKERSIF